jgi:glutaminase
VQSVARVATDDVDDDVNRLGLLESPIQAYLQELHADIAVDTSGEVATYIPELARADPREFAIAVATVDGPGYDVGDATTALTLQSISKPFLFGLALEDHGPETVLARVGVEPSGDSFNSITVDPVSNRPFNPLVNAGAIVITSLVRGRGADERFARILARDLRALHRSPGERRRRRLRLRAFHR